MRGVVVARSVAREYQVYRVEGVILGYVAREDGTVFQPVREVQGLPFVYGCFRSGKASVQLYARLQFEAVFAVGYVHLLLIGILISAHPYLFAGPGAVECFGERSSAFP